MRKWVWLIANHKGITNAAGGFLTSYIQRDHHKKIGAFVRRVSIFPLTDSTM